MTSANPARPTTSSPARRDGAGTGTTTGRATRGWPVLVGLLVLNALVAGVGGLASTSGVDGWYAG